MVNDGFQAYSKVFFVFFVTSRMFTKSGPLHSLFITKTLQKLQDKSPIVFINIIFTYLNSLDVQSFQNVGKDGGRKTPKESFNEILKNLDMGPISTKKHECVC